jgi:nucleoid-associated protein EbfC
VPGTPNPTLRQLEQMCIAMGEAQEQLRHEAVVGSAGGGTVTITLSGELEPKNVHIAPGAVDDVELLQDLVQAALTEALRAAQQLATDRVNAATSLADPLAGPHKKG